MQIELDASSVQPLTQQLYGALRAAILDGSLLSGDRLPASRQMAQQLGVARVTVVTAYKQLSAEGFVTVRGGAGTYVAALPEHAPPQLTQDRVELSSWATRALRLSSEKQAPRTYEIDFGFGRNFPHAFPYNIWRKLLSRYLSTDDTMLSRYGSAAGFEPLRQALVTYLGRVRGVRCSAEQIVIVNGVQQAVDIVSRLLLNAGDDVLVETPGYVEAYKLLQVYGAALKGIQVDDLGFPPAAIPSDSAAKLLFVTPTNQFPRGGTMPLSRRLQLLQWAQQQNAYILEDDYDSELRYDGQPVGALQGLDEAGRVIYLGTFSKVLFPALRLAYVVLPKQLVPPFLAAKRLIDRGSPTLTQAAIADFILEGHFEKHLRKLRHTYGERRHVLVEELLRQMPSDIRFGQTPAGLHVMVKLPKKISERELVRISAEKYNLGIYPAAPYHLGPNPDPAILLGFSAISAEEIPHGIERLAQAYATVSDQ